MTKTCGDPMRFTKDDLEALREKADDAMTALEAAMTEHQDEDAYTAMVEVADLMRGLAEASRTVHANAGGFKERFDAYAYPSVLEAANLIEGSANELKEDN